MIHAKVANVIGQSPHLLPSWSSFPTTSIQKYEEFFLPRSYEDPFRWARISQTNPEETKLADIKRMPAWRCCKSTAGTAMHSSRSMSANRHLHDLGAAAVDEVAVFDHVISGRTGHFFVRITPSFGDGEVKIGHDAQLLGTVLPRVF